MIKDLAVVFIFDLSDIEGANISNSINSFISAAASIKLRQFYILFSRYQASFL